MKITVMRNAKGVTRVSLGTVMYGESRVAPDDKFDFSTGICVALVKADNKLIEKMTEMFYATYWQEFELADPYVELVMKHQRNYNRELAARKERNAIHEELINYCMAAHSDRDDKYYVSARVEILPPCDFDFNEGSIALRHALALKKDLEEEVKWQKAFEGVFSADETERLPWPLQHPTVEEYMESHKDDFSWPLAK